MADGTHIEWADASWNPLRARDKETGRIGWFCTHASEGCRFCYAERLNRRLGTGVDYRAQDADRIELFLDEKILAQPLSWRRPRRIFTLSMSDLFGEFVPDAMIDRIVAAIGACDDAGLGHQFLVLTKRARRQREYFAGGAGYRAWNSRRLGPEAWPPRNIWAMVSAEDQKTADERIPDLLATPAARRGVSLEPLLGPIDLPLGGRCRGCGHINSHDGLACEGCGRHAFTDRLDWVIVGGESGRGARPMHPAWPRSLRDQCQGAGVPFFFKQWGEFAPGVSGQSLAPDGSSPGPDKWNDPSTAWMQRVGKRAAGRLLDGVEHSEFPA